MDDPNDPKLRDTPGSERFVDLDEALTAPYSEQPVRLSCSVIVPAYDAKDYLGRCIHGLLAAGFAHEEIICVDDGSSDGTANFLRQMGIEPLVLEDNQGAAYARNTGARRAQSDILFFVDADVVVHPDARERIDRFFAAETGYAAIFGCYDDQPAGDHLVNRFRNLFHRHVHVQSAGDAVTFWTGCGAVRRDAFEIVGGFDSEQRMMEDVRFGLKLHSNGHRIRLDPDLQATHLKRWKLTSMFWTDLVNRAVPWTRLLRTPLGKASNYRLNLSLTGRLSGLSVAGSLIGAGLALISPTFGVAVIVAMVALLAWLNREFLRLMRRTFGAGDALLAVPLLWLHYLSAGLGFAYATLVR
ncbi:glycosyltransferase family 2 protein [Erythrobacter sp.]|jgi:GT2 family glycosyltransferase|uniref:glycosyltransferase family 2 protein n=1 Tax=Erythrobacter sp. TaxID=1042 RepID=UPI002EA0C768|nr:glycosyltransferase family 2 protein [Erythrobacter sp.]